MSLKTNLKFIWSYEIPANKRGIIEDYPLLQIPN